jgi:hypothetical protein
MMAGRQRCCSTQAAANTAQSSKTPENNISIDRVLLETVAMQAVSPRQAAGYLSYKGTSYASLLIQRPHKGDQRRVCFLKDTIQPVSGSGLRVVRH